ncbi:MAG TPA: SIS domain-containing protein [Bryobacteraceae bacterium]|nr:SIS domain-containing protein [Bryobacteraceae bacterium]
MSRMLEDIRQEPAVLESALRAEVATFRGLCSRFEKERPRFVVLAARGTSDHAAQFGRYLIEVATGIPVSLAAPSVFTLYRAEMDFREVLYVGVSQSGESMDVNACIGRARELGATTIGITNEPTSTLARTAERLVQLHAGSETGVAATKTWVSQLLSMYLLTWSLGADLTLEQIRHIPEWTAAALQLEPEIAERAQRYAFAEKALVVGRGFNYANALEFAHKLMEVCYVVAESFSSADFLHGPIALAERGVPAFAFAPPGPTWPGIRDTLARLETAGSSPLVITDERNAEARARRSVIALASVDGQDPSLPVDALTAIPYAVPAQLLAAHIAEHKGLDPDQPRMLAKVAQTI